MLSGFGTLLDRLQGLLSKGFLLGGFMPFLVLCLVNLGLIHWLYPAVYANVYEVIQPPEKEELYFWLTLIFVSFSGGLLFWCINPYMRQFLEGRFMPQFIQSFMLRGQQKHLDYLVAKKEAIQRELFEYRACGKNLETRVKDARTAGGNKPPAPVTAGLIQLFDDIRHRAKRNKLPFTALDDFRKQLLAELEQNPADEVRDLEKLRKNFLGLFHAQWRKLESAFQKIINEQEQLFPADSGKVGATQLANYSEVHREYGLSRYGLDIEYFWNRLLKFIRNDADFFPVLEEAKIQLDFSVAMTVVFFFTVTGWSLISLFFIQAVSPFFFIFGLGIPCFAMFYRIAAQNYRGFADTVRSAIDLYRFKLLEALHLEMPADSDAEKKLWNILTTASLQDNPVTYDFSKHSPTEETGTLVKQSWWLKFKTWLKS